MLSLLYNDVAGSTTEAINQSTESLLIDLSKNILKTDNVLILVDPRVVTDTEFDQVLRDGFSNCFSYSLLTWDDADLLQDFPTHFMRGTFMTVLLLFMSNPMNFLNSLEEMLLFNPDYFILYSLNEKLDMDQIERHDTVQRSQFLTSVKPSGKTGRFLVSSIYHTTYVDHRDSGVEMKLGQLGSAEISSKNEFFQRERRNFFGAHIELASFCDDFPFLYNDKWTIENLDYLNVHECKGVNLDILDILAKKHNFTYDFQMHPTDFRWAGFENGSWTGMLGQLQNKEKQMVINGLMLSEMRYSSFDSSETYFQGGFGVVIKIPATAPKWKGVLYPFSNTVWLTILFVTLFVGLVWISGLICLPDAQHPDQAFLQVIPFHIHFPQNKDFYVNSL